MAGRITPRSSDRETVLPAQSEFKEREEKQNSKAVSRAADSTVAYKRLMSAISAGNVVKVFKLLRTGMDPNFVPKDLIEQNSIIDPCSMTTFECKPDKVKQIEKERTRNVEYSYAFAEGRANQVSPVSTFIRYGSGAKPLFRALATGNLDMIELLLCFKADPNQIYARDLCLAIFDTLRPSTDRDIFVKKVLELLLEAGWKPEEKHPYIYNAYWLDKRDTGVGTLTLLESDRDSALYNTFTSKLKTRSYDDVAWSQIIRELQKKINIPRRPTVAEPALNPEHRLPANYKTLMLFIDAGLPVSSLLARGAIELNDTPKEYDEEYSFLKLSNKTLRVPVPFTKVAPFGHRLFPSGKLPLFRAVAKLDSTNVEALLIAGADPNLINPTDLYLAITDNSLTGEDTSRPDFVERMSKVMTLLLRAGLNPNRRHPCRFSMESTPSLIGHFDPVISSRYEVTNNREVYTALQDLLKKRENGCLEPLKKRPLRVPMSIPSHEGRNLFPAAPVPICPLVSVEQQSEETESKMKYDGSCQWPPTPWR